MLYSPLAQSTATKITAALRRALGSLWRVEINRTDHQSISLGAMPSIPAVSDWKIEAPPFPLPPHTLLSTATKIKAALRRALDFLGRVQIHRRDYLRKHGCDIKHPGFQSLEARSPPPPPPPDPIVALRAAKVADYRELRCLTVPGCPLLQQ
jgi:hypothetical protein